MRLRQPHSRRALCATTLAVLATAVGWCGTAAGQAGGLRRSDINAILKDKNLSGAQQQQFDAYFVQFFKQFDNPAVVQQDLLTRLRAELRNYLKYGKSGAAHDRLNDLTLKKMDLIIRGRYPSATKYTAMLILGELNSQDQEPGRTLTPYAPSLRYLKVGALNPRVPDDIRIAGLIGLERFAADGGIPDSEKPALTKGMLDLLRETEPPPGRSTDGHNWIRRGAANVLAALGSPGPDDAVVKAMETVIADPSARPSFRCEMAEHVGQIKFPADSKTDIQALANLLGHQTVELCKEQLGSATQTVRESESAVVRKQLAFISFSTLHGLDGTSAGGGLMTAAKKAEESRSFVGRVREKVDAICQSLEESETPNVEDLRNKLADLEAILLPKPVPKPAPPVEEKKEQTAELAKQPNAARAEVARPGAGGG